MLLRIIGAALAVTLLTTSAQAQDKAAPDDGTPAQKAPSDSPPDAELAPDESTGETDDPKPAEKPAEKPAGKPAATPRTRRADEAALREALRTLARSLQEGKADGIKQVVYAATPTERKMVDAMAAMAVQMAALYKASAKAFGDQQAKSLAGDATAEMGRIDQAEVSIDGDTATVRYKPDAPPAETAHPDPDPDHVDEPAAAVPSSMVLKRVDGRWRVPMSELSKDATPEGIEQRLADLDAQTKVIGELAKEISKGKYRSAEKAAEAWQSKMMQALTPGRKPEDEKGGAGDGEKQDGRDGAKKGTGDVEQGGGEGGEQPRDEGPPTGKRSGPADREADPPAEAQQ